MASLTEIRDGLATQLGTIPSLYQRTYDVFPDKFVEPCALVEVVSGLYDQTFGGLTRYTLRIVLLVAPFGKGLTRGQEALDPYLASTGEYSVKAAVDADPSLGGVADNVRVPGFPQYGVIEANGQQYIGATFDVEVLAS